MAKGAHVVRVPGYAPFTMIMMVQEEDAFAVVRARESVAELLTHQHLPPWFDRGAPLVAVAGTAAAARDG